ncbi:MAG: IPT/TIG domain-containing protein [Bacteroidota bacterium]
MKIRLSFWLIIGLLWLWLGLSGAMFAQNNMRQVEYFIDTDPGFGAGIRLPLTNAAQVANFKFAINVSGLEAGFHLLGVRTQDTDLVWSQTHIRPFFVEVPTATLPVINIVKGEYFIDADPGFGNGINIPMTASPTISGIVFTVDMDALSAGFHRLYIRTHDAQGNWSQMQSRPFFHEVPTTNQPLINITQAEYFVDNDPGAGSGTGISITPNMVINGLTFPVDLNAVNLGFHRLFVRSRDANGHWSHAHGRPFFKTDLAVVAALPNLNRIEYYIDTDPGIGSGVSVPFAPTPTVAHLPFLVDVSNLGDGTHRLFARSRDANGHWSSTLSQEFIKISASLPTNIAFFSPTSGVVGTTVILTGTNFNTVAANNAVRFGTVSATVTAATATSLTVTVPAGLSGNTTISLTANNQTASATTQFFVIPLCPDITLTPNTLPAATQNAAFSQQLTASGGAGPYDYSLASGRFPIGLTISSDGLLSGTPTEAGSFTFAIQAKDANACLGSQAYTLKVNAAIVPAPTITSFSPASGNVGSEVIITGTNFSTAPVNNVVSFGAFQASVTAATDTQLNVIVPVGISGSVAISVTIGGKTATAGTNFTITVPCSILTLSPTTLPIATQQAAYSQLLTAGGGFPPYGYQLSAGTLPLGVTLSAGGLLSGTPTQAGNFTFTVQVSDNNGCAGSRTFTLAVNNPLAPPPTITSFFPMSDVVGSLVTIKGANFSPILANNIVYFGGVRGVVTVATANELTVIVPFGASYQSISTTVGGLTAYSPLPFVPTFADGGIINQYSFAPKVDIATGAGTWGQAAGDLDGNGKVDLVVANSSANSVSLLRNVSIPGALSPASFVSTSLTGLSGAIDVALGDVDGDGKLDVAVANSSAATVSVFRNLANAGTLNTASFAPKTDFLVGNNPYSLAIADLDGDGRPDIAVANRGTQTISLLRNVGHAGNIAFANKVDFPAPSAPFHLRMADLDGDGKPEIILAHDGATVSVYQNTSIPGTLALAARANYPTGANSNAVALGDLNNDGKPEVVTSNFNGRSASILTNNRAAIGSISFMPNVDFPSNGGGTIGVALGDLDGDRKPDMAICNQESNRLSLFKNRVTGTAITASGFDPSVQFTTGTAPRSMVIADFDGDGRPDLSTGNASTGNVSIFRNTVTPAGPPPTITSFSPASGIAGSTVTITGTNFGTVLLNNEVRFGIALATITAFSTTQLTVLVPTGISSSVAISVMVEGQTAISSTDFTITSPTTSNIDKAEYFFNTDPGFGLGTNIPLSPGPILPNLTFSLAVNALPFGLNRLYLRTRDADGHWSQTHVRSIFHETPTASIPLANITKGEYFMDTDPGFGKGTGIALTPNPAIEGLVFGIDLDALSAGLHRLYIRTQDANGLWSQTHVRPIFHETATASIPLANITRVEYFIDTDPGVGSGVTIPITPNPAINGLTFPIDLNSLSLGFHRLYLRTRDANGLWSISHVRPFFKTDLAAVAALPNLNRIEYFIDTDPGLANATAVPFTPASIVTGLPFVVDVSSLTDGIHRLFARSRDANGAWSSTVIREFVKTSLPITPTITAFTPALGLVGSTVTITGTNFNTIPGNNVVRFGTGQATVTAATATSLTVTVPSGTSGSVAISVTVGGFTATSATNFTIICPTITLLPTTALSTTQNVAYSQQISAIGGTKPYAFSLTTGNLPAGITLSAAGVLSGTPTVLGSFTFSIQAKDANLCQGSQTYTLTVTSATVPLPTITSFTPTLGAVGTMVTITGTNFNTILANNEVRFGTTAATVTAATATSLTVTVPSGVSGSVAISVTVGGFTATSATNFTVNSPCPTITLAPATLPNATQNTPYNQPITASGGALPYTFFVTTGNLPAGIVLSESGEVSGTSTVTGSFTFSIQATDANACTGIHNYTLLVNEVNSPLITFTDLTRTYGNAPFDLTISSNSLGAITYAVLSGSGATITPAGEVTITGAGKVTIQAQQSASGPFKSGSATATLTIDKANLAVTAENKTKVAGEANPPFTFTYGNFVGSDNATNAIELPPSIGTTATMASLAGTYPITLSGGNSANYAFIFQNGSLTVSVSPATRQNQTIAFDSLPDLIFGNQPISLLATAASGLPVSFRVVTGLATLADNVLTINGAGKVTIQASQAGNDHFNPAPEVAHTFCVKPGQPTFLQSPNRVCTSSQTYGVNPIPGVTYAWAVSGGSTVSGTGATTQVDWTTPGTYTLSVTPAANCGDPGEAQIISVTVGTGATPPLSSITGDTVVCGGIHTYQVDSVAGAHYVWSLSGGGDLKSINHTSEINWKSQGFFTLSVALADSCGMGQVQTLRVRSDTTLSARPVITNLSNSLISSSPTGNQWYYRGEPIDDATGQRYEAVLFDFDYTLQVTNGCGTSQVSSAFNFLVNGLSSPASQGIEIYPNPAADVLTVDIPMDMQWRSLTLYAVNGKAVVQRNYEKTSSLHLNVGQLAAGLYTIVLQLEKGTIVRRIIAGK